MRIVTKEPVNKGNLAVHKLLTLGKEPEQFDPHSYAKLWPQEEYIGTMKAEPDSSNTYELKIEKVTRYSSSDGKVDMLNPKKNRDVFESAIKEDYGIEDYDTLSL